MVANAKPCATVPYRAENAEQEKLGVIAKAVLALLHAHDFHLRLTDAGLQDFGHSLVHSVSLHIGAQRSIGDALEPHRLHKRINLRTKANSRTVAITPVALGNCACGEQHPASYKRHDEQTRTTESTLDGIPTRR